MLNDNEKFQTERKKLFPRLPLSKSIPIFSLILIFVSYLVWNVLIIPVEVINTTPAYMREDLQEDYLRMAIESYAYSPDLNLALMRWQCLGVDAQKAYLSVQSNPSELDPVVIKEYGQAITDELSQGSVSTAPCSDAQNSSTTELVYRSIVFVLACVIYFVAVNFIKSEILLWKKRNAISKNQ